MRAMSPQPRYSTKILLFSGNSGTERLETLTFVQPSDCKNYNEANNDLNKESDNLFNDSERMTKDEIHVSCMRRVTKKQVVEDSSTDVRDNEGDLFIRDFKEASAREFGINAVSGLSVGCKPNKQKRTAGDFVSWEVERLCDKLVGSGSKDAM